MITNLHEIEKVIAAILVQQSELENDRIINGLSIRGPELSKYIQDKILHSYNINDSVIIFELIMDYDNTLNITEYDEKNIRSNIAAKIELTIYGNESINLANILKARLESEKVRNILLENEIYLSTISNISSLNEYENDTMWLRTNMTLNVIVELQVNEITKSDEIEDIGTLNNYTV